MQSGGTLYFVPLPWQVAQDLDASYALVMGTSGHMGPGGLQLDVFNTTT